MADYILGDRGSVEVITDDFYDAEILHLFEELVLDREQVWAGSAHLVPELDNPYQPSAIAVYVDDLKVGRLSVEDSAAYWLPLSRVVASGYRPVVYLQIHAVLRSVGGQQVIESQGVLSLSAPSSLFPLNEAPRQAALLPQGDSMKVLDEKDHSEYLHSILPPSGEGRVILSLENNQMKLADGRVVQSVDVLHDRRVVGRLSTQMSEQLAPVIRYAYEQDRLTAAWGTIRGNAFELSLTVQAVRPHEIEEDWFAQLPNDLPELLPAASAYQLEPAYQATEGEAQRAKKKRGLLASARPQVAESEPADQEGLATSQASSASAVSGLQRMSILLGLVGGLVLIFGLVTVFSNPLMGILAIVFGGSLAFLALFFTRDNSYREEAVSADRLEH